MTFYCANHQGDNIARIIQEARKFVADNPLPNADWRLAGGLIGVTAAANEEILKNNLYMHGLGFGTIFLIVMFTYRSPVAAVVMMIGLFLADGVVNAYMGVRNIGINFAVPAGGHRRGRIWHRLCLIYRQSSSGGI